MAGRADRIGGLLWVALGTAVAWESWRMDRLAGQGVEPYSVPGLLPGLLGLVLTLFGVLLALRRAPAVTEPHAEAEPPAEMAAWRAALALLLCGGFALGALGRLPFPLAAFGFVFLAIVLFEWPDRPAGRARARGMLRAGLVAAGAAAAVTLIFQEVFLVRLP